MSTVDWPSSPLDAAERAFNLLVQPPTHVGFDGRGFDGLPDQIVPLDELRDLLLTSLASEPEPVNTIPVGSAPIRAAT